MSIWLRTLFDAWLRLPWHIRMPDMPVRQSLAAERHAHLLRQGQRRMSARFPDCRSIH